LYGCLENGHPLDHGKESVGNGKSESGQTLSLPTSIDIRTRESLEDNIYFRVPSSWTTAGTKKFAIHWPKNSKIQCAGATGVSSDCEFSATFNEVQNVQLELIPVVVPEMLGSLPLTWHADTCDQIINRFPWSNINVTCRASEHPVVLESAATEDDEKNLFDALLSRKLADFNCLGSQCPNKFYLAISPSPINGWGGLGHFPGKMLSNTAWSEMPSSIAAGPAHELGHNLGLEHTTNRESGGYKVGECKEEAMLTATYPDFPSPSIPGQRGDFPYFDEFLRPLLGPSIQLENPDNDENTVFMYDSLKKSIRPFRSTATMSYCFSAMSPRFPAITNYIATYKRFQASAASYGKEQLGANTTPYYVVLGQFIESADTATIESVMNLIPAAVPETPDPNEWVLIGHRTVLDDVEVPASASSSPNIPDKFTLAGSMPFDPDITGFSFERNSTVKATLTQSPNAPVVSITAPIGGEVFGGEPLTLDWLGDDVDGDDLDYSIEYSIDDGVTWNLIASGWSGPPFVIDPELLLSSKQARFRVTASDGFNEGSDALDSSITVLNIKVFDDSFE